MSLANYIFLLLLLTSVFDTNAQFANMSFWKKRISCTSFTCPTGFVAVPANPTLGTSDFCVMKYQARDSAGVPISQSSGTPWVNISAPDAQTECESMSEGGFSGTFTLISNPEWMTIARNIESVASNWSGGSVGSGHIPRGHSDGSPASILTITDTADPYDGTGNNSGQAPGSGWEQKRTHILSNGCETWDFSGNAWQWVDWDASAAGFTLGPVDGTASWQVLTSLSGSIVSNDVQSSGGYTSTQSFGDWYGGNGGGARRGGNSTAGTNNGVFNLNLNRTATNPGGGITFRCVYRP